MSRRTGFAGFEGECSSLFQTISLSEWGPGSLRLMKPPFTEPSAFNQKGSLKPPFHWLVADGLFLEELALFCRAEI
jgi:hypothetical protein